MGATREAIELLTVAVQDLAICVERLQKPQPTQSPQPPSQTQGVDLPTEPGIVHGPCEGYSKDWLPDGLWILVRHPDEQHNTAWSAEVVHISAATGVVKQIFLGAGDFAIRLPLSGNWLRVQAQPASEGELPATFYADRPFHERLRFMVDAWRKAVQAQARLTELEGDLESVNSLARDLGYGQGEIDTDIAACLREAIARIDLRRKELEGENARLRQQDEAHWKIIQACEKQIDFGLYYPDEDTTDALPQAVGRMAAEHKAAQARNVVLTAALRGAFEIIDGEYGNGIRNGYWPAIKPIHEAMSAALAGTEAGQAGDPHEYIANLSEEDFAKLAAHAPPPAAEQGEVAWTEKPWAIEELEARNLRQGSPTPVEQGSHPTSIHELISRLAGITPVQKAVLDELARRIAALRQRQRRWLGWWRNLKASRQNGQSCSMLASDSNPSSRPARRRRVVAFIRAAMS